MRRLLMLLAIATVAIGSGLQAQLIRRRPARPAAVQPAPAATAPATTVPVATLPAAVAPSTVAPAAVAPADRSGDEKAIRALLDTFTKAFDAGDAKAAADTYTETAIIVDEEGTRTEGRAAILDLYAASFEDNPGSKIAIQVDNVRFLGPETALEQGRATITPAPGAGAPEITRYTAIYIKQGGNWLQSAVKDEVAADVTPREHLKELEWLVGEWINESSDAIVSTNCKWAQSGNFIDREFTMKTQGQPVFSGTQRIGWDPLKQQFKTWIFDSEGGHSEGYWTRNGNQWVIKIEGVNQDGKAISATNIVTRFDKDRIGWESVDRTAGAAALPGIDQFIVVRKPPEVGK
jgi:uncharacterized protein (TIGR02246 family)